MSKSLFFRILFSIFHFHAMGFSAEISSEELLQNLPENPFFIPSEKVSQIIEETQLDIDELLVRLIPIAQSYARPPISNYKVGAAAIGKSGNIYLGVNLEFIGLPLNFDVHAEQFLIANARYYGENGIVKIALSAPPCGHCRQFLNEIDTDHQLEILIPNHASETLSFFLPEAFGPQNLGIKENPWEVPNTPIHHTSPLAARALEAAMASYAPYSQSKSGVALETSDGNIYSGSYLENAAFNPSLSPLQMALVALLADLHDYKDIQQVYLVEESRAKISQEEATRALIKHIAPQAQFGKELLH